MVKIIESKGKTLNEAIENGILKLGINREDAEINVVQAPSKGLFGIGNKDAIVEIKFSDSPKNKAVEFLSDVFSKMNLDVKIDCEEKGDELSINLSGDQMGILIGRRGETLDALQYLTRLVINKGENDYLRVTLDTENYRSKREQTLIKLADKLASKVLRTKRSVALEPMNPFERKIIHAALQGNKNLNTYSVGEEPHRKIIIAYAKKEA